MRLRLLTLALILPLAACAGGPHRRTAHPALDPRAPAELQTTLDLLEGGHARAMIFQGRTQANLQAGFEAAQSVLENPRAPATDKAQAAAQVQDLARWLDRTIVATHLQVYQVANHLVIATEICQDVDRPAYYRARVGASPVTCARLELAAVQWNMDRQAVAQTRDRLQRLRGDAEVAVINAKFSKDIPLPLSGTRPAVRCPLPQEVRAIPGSAL